MAHKDDMASAEVKELDEELTAAYKRIGISQELRLRWFLDFSNRDLSQLSSTERATLDYELLAAGGASGARDSYERYRDLRALSSRALAKLQREIRVFVPVLFEVGERSIKGPEHVILRRVSAPAAKQSKFEWALWSKDVSMWCLYGFMLAIQYGGQRLRLCKRCKKAFVATKRQEYCSANCSQITRNDTKKVIREMTKKNLK